ncbi:hypothetical protein [Massilia horti]|uniref:Uncharacterized protein n=1 Tax=Massilia horti TaxID=2562153 RepID=A0A4Y9SVB1_9BURK|nr:hypothetical protein [Massilia horti]TFW30405.1 hypothetical protein E4O92_17110 [Massilia horti]
MTTSFDPVEPHILRRFALGLALLLALIFALRPAKLAGDVEDYTLTTIALAHHASPDIRSEDIATAKALVPQLVPALELLEQEMAAGKKVPRGAFFRGRDGGVYTMHFFAYPALAALPFKILESVRADPLKCYLAVNLASLFVLGLALLRLFGTALRASVGLLLFMLCGGVLYGEWSSPECVSAAGLLAAMCLYLTGAPLAGGLLAGLAAMQNPSVGAFAAFAPLMRLCLEWRRGESPLANVTRAIGPRQLAGACITAALFAVPILFSLWEFGIPSIIGKIATSTSLATPNRLHSFFFDLNQGMIVGVPAVLAALLLWGWRGPGRAPALTLCAAAFTLIMALPTLVIHNWNAGATGFMRYAFWAAMPLLFAFLWRLRVRARWPWALVAVVLVAQWATIRFERSYTMVQFSPLAHWVLAHAPGAYNPDPEIFQERLVNDETSLEENRVDIYRVDGAVRKAMYHKSNVNAGTLLCEAGQTMAHDNQFVELDRQWRYVNGPIRCVPVREFVPGQAGLELGEGWSYVEHGGGIWEGAWSKAPTARLTVAYAAGQRPGSLTLRGLYYGNNKRTRVRIDGVDLGWKELDRAPTLPVPNGTQDSGKVTVDLEFDAPHNPPPEQADQRKIAFFLRQISRN